VKVTVDMLNDYCCMYDPLYSIIYKINFESESLFKTCKDVCDGFIIGSVSVHFCGISAIILGTGLQWRSSRHSNKQHW